MTLFLARPERFERPTPRFVVWCSIQLSYGRAARRHIRSGARLGNPLSPLTRKQPPGERAIERRHVERKYLLRSEPADLAPLLRYPPSFPTPHHVTQKHNRK